MANRKTSTPLYRVVAKFEDGSLYKLHDVGALNLALRLARYHGDDPRFAQVSVASPGEHGFDSPKIPGGVPTPEGHTETGYERGLRRASYLPKTGRPADPQRPLSRAQQSLVQAAHTLGKIFTLEQLSVAAWKLDPTSWGMRGDLRYPDTRRVSNGIHGVRGLLRRGYLVQPESRYYALADKTVVQVSCGS